MYKTGGEPDRFNETVAQSRPEQAPQVYLGLPTGTFSRLEINSSVTSTISMFCNNEVVKVFLLLV